MKYEKMALVSFAVFFIILAGIAFIRFGYPVFQKAGPDLPFIPAASGPDKIIAKVGQESLYQKDLDQLVAIEAKNASPSAQAEMKKVLIGKLVYQSVMLQAAQTEQLTTLDATIFNSKDKDLAKRSETVDLIKNTINEQADGIHGTVVLIWFNTPDSSLSYEKAKQTAYEAIKPLYDKVKKGELTTKQAADQLKNKPELLKLDQNFKGYFFQTFRVKPNMLITRFSKFDNMLKMAQTGQLTELYLAKDTEYSDTSSPLDKNYGTSVFIKEKKDRGAAYLFGKVDKIVRDSSKVDASSWYQERVGRYEVVYY